MPYKKDSYEARFGDAGEDVAKDFLGRTGKYHVMGHRLEGGHDHDFFIINKKTKKLVPADIKTKYKYYKTSVPSTGFETKHYKKYKEAEKEHGCFFVFFVDLAEGKIYGNWLSELEKNIVDPSVKFTQNGERKETIVFARSAMREYAALSPQEIKKLKAVK